MRVRVNTVATKGMIGDLNPLGDGQYSGLADHGARVPEVLPAAELEGFLTGLIIAMPREPVLGWAMMLPIFRVGITRTAREGICKKKIQIIVGVAMLFPNT